jgi:hypothetical protein
MNLVSGMFEGLLGLGRVVAADWQRANYCLSGLPRCFLPTLQLRDPLMRHLEGGLLVPPIAIVATALGALYAGFICFAQSVRLYVHTGFYIRACTSKFNPGTLTVAEAKRVTIHAGLAFSSKQGLHGG